MTLEYALVPISYIWPQNVSVIGQISKISRKLAAPEYPAQLYLPKSIHGLQFGSWIPESFVGIWINNLSVLQILLHIVIQRQLFNIAFVLFERSILPTSVA